VMDAGALQHRPHRSTGDHTGTGAGRLQQHDPGGLLTLYRVRDGGADSRDLEEVLLGLLHALGDRRRHLLGLAVADPHGAVTVADHHQCREAEPAATLDHLGDPVDGDHALEVGALLRGRAPAAFAAALPAAFPATLAAARAPLWTCH